MLLGGLIAWSTTIEVTAQAPPTADPPGELTEAFVQQRLGAVDSLGLDEAAKARVIEAYQGALERIRDGDRWRDRATQELSVEVLGGRLQRAREALAEVTKPIELPSQDTSTLQEVERAHERASVKASGLRSDFQKREGEVTRLTERRAQLPRLLQDARDRLGDAQRQLTAPAVPDELPEVTAARSLRLRARVRSLELEVAAIEQEVQTVDLQSDVLAAERELAARLAGEAERELNAWERVLAERRQRETELAKIKAEAVSAEVERVDPALKAEAERNAALAAEEAELKATIAQRTEEERNLGQVLQALESSFADIRKRVEAGGLTEAVGLQLGDRRSQLPDVRAYRQKARERAREIAKRQLQRFNLDDELLTLVDLDTALSDLLESAEVPLDPGSIQQAREILEERRRLSRSVLDDLDRCLALLANLGVKEAQLVDRTLEFQNYIDERVLWIRSTLPIWSVEFSPVPRAIAWLLDPAHWREALSALVHDLRENPASAAFSWLLVIVIFVGVPRLRRLLSDAGKTAGQRSNISFTPTAKALLATLWLSLPLSLALWVTGIRLSAGSATSPFVLGLSKSLEVLAGLLLLGQLIRQLCRPGGAGELHFGWKSERLAVVRRHVFLLLPVLLACSFLAQVFAVQKHAAWPDTIGRAAFIASLLATAFFGHLVFRTARGALSAGTDGSTWSVGGTRAMYLAAVGTPLALAGLAVAGYYYTAHQLGLQLTSTVWLGLGVIVAWSASIRWLRLSRKRALLAERERRQQADGTATESVPEPATNLVEIDQSVRKLLRACLLVVSALGLWMIWAEELPALAILEKVEFWQNVETVTASKVGGDGISRVESEERVVPVTLAHVLLTMVIVFLTFFAARHLPALLEITILQRLDLKSGERYAVATVVRYFITGVGLVAAFGTLGVGWSRIQWLVAALTVGLGFGLQEIFANFVSGLIILFERPIRLGDVVTVEPVTGTVTQIRIRATTITDWDRKEFVVPNREFITGRVLNWTLSDSINRVVVHVGVAYGTDTAKAIALLLEAARENRLLQKSPAPIATFEGFGDSTLNLVLRAFLPDLDNRLQVISDLHTAIDRKFKAEGIEIAFPQRDLHVRTLPPGWLPPNVGEGRSPSP